MRPLLVVPLFFVLFFVLFAGLSALAHSSNSESEIIPDSYALPGELLALGDGRELNLRCSGEGEPVVMLEAGGNSDSSTWFRVQPGIARLTRVCAYDRAGYGFSEEGPYPRDLEADVADLRAIIQSADISMPVLLVGHSLGSNIVRRYAQLYPHEVAGMVLVDPPEQGGDDQMPQDWQTQIALMLAQREEILSLCEQAAEAGDVETMQQTCLRAPPPWMSEAVALAMARNKSKPAYWRSLRSELKNNIDLFSAPVPAEESYGSIPLVLLAATEQSEDAPDAVLAVMQANRRHTHARILAASTDSSVIEVPDASHDLQLDQPYAVVSAVKGLLSNEAVTPVGEIKLVADDGAPEDFFGFDVALSDDTAVIGANKADDNIKGSDAGAAYVFARAGLDWQQQAKLTAADGAAQDGFGGRVALFGDTAVIGAMFRDDMGEDSGAAYVFTRTGTTWSQQAKLTAADGTEGDAFGQSIALFGDTVVIGAPRDDDKGNDAGSVYVFTRSGTSWSQQDKLTAADGAEGDVFGISSAMTGDTIVIGADLNDEKAVDAGAVYVFSRSGNSWSQQVKLTAADGAETDIFGVRVALSGDTILISARRDDDDVLGIDAGSAYIFTRTGTTWQQQTKLTASDGAADDRFGRDVALVGDTAVIGAMFRADKGDNSGAAYVFKRTGTSWSQVSKLTAADGAQGDVFGSSVALSDDTAIITAPRDDDKGNESGSAYVFEIKRD